MQETIGARTAISPMRSNPKAMEDAGPCSTLST
ncbi:hypothetical protein ACVIQW_001441 [Bradyrhizobium diazoefficiens]